MTRSQLYAFERSKDLAVPVVLFDEAEVALFMLDPSLFPCLRTTKIKGWLHVKTLTLDIMSADEVDAQILLMVVGETTYGFAIVGTTEAGAQIGVFERVPQNAKVFEVPFKGSPRERVLSL